jgi:hypothetical protein
MKLGLETDAGAMQHDFVVGRFRPDGQKLAGCCHVEAHDCFMARRHANSKLWAQF